MPDRCYGPDSPLLHEGRAKAREVLAAKVRGVSQPVPIDDPLELVATLHAMTDYAVYLIGLLAAEMKADPEEMLEGVLERMHKHERSRLRLVDEEE